MSWSLYRWVWRLEAPLYVGMPPAGVLSRCRLYVPARNVWAVFTAELAQRRMGSNPTDLGEYEQVGEKLREACRFSYLYPAEWGDGKSMAWLPRFEQSKGLYWTQEGKPESISDAAMRRRLLDARPGTAIEPSAGSAAEGSLHETELITPWWRNSSESELHPLAMAGYLFCRDNKISDDLHAINEIYLGGDTRYGLGKMVRARIEATTQLFDNNTRLDGDEPQVYTAIVLAHAEAGKPRGSIMGALERLGGWDIGMLKPMGDTPLWVPGSHSMNSGDLWWRIREDGIWFPGV